jgi:hypothetical protein
MEVGGNVLQNPLEKYDWIELTRRSTSSSSQDYWLEAKTISRTKSISPIHAFKAESINFTNVRICQCHDKYFL